jgi:hypothetical protein
MGGWVDLQKLIMVLGRFYPYKGVEEKWQVIASLCSLCMTACLS